MDAEKHTDTFLEGLHMRIRTQAAQRRAQIAASAPLTPQAPAPWTFNWMEARRRMDIASRMSRIAAPPQLSNSRSWRRWISSLTARTVTRLTRFMTNRQTDYNVCLLETVHDLAAALHEMETRAIQNQEQIRQLENVLVQLQMRMGSSCNREQGRRAS